MSSATGAGTRVGVTLKLSQLQNLCKRDPEGYREDYDAQVRRLESECGILALSPASDPSPRLVELIQFAAAVASSSYKGKEADRIATMLINLLLGSTSDSKQQTQNKAISMSLPTSALSLHRDVRKACVSALILMRNKGAIEPLRLLELFFRILSVVPDKGLRELLYSHIVNDIKNINKKGKRDEKVNRSIQSFLHRVVSMDNHGSNDDATDMAQKRATDMVCELYRRAVWTDDRAVAILASAAASRNNTVMCRAMRFFLNIEEKMAHDKKIEEEDEWSGINQIDLHSHSKKTKQRARQVARQLANRRKAQKKKENPDWLELEEKGGIEHAKKLYPAIELLRDPQGSAEATLKRLKGNNSSLKYEVKLLMINFVTRLVGNHELMLLPLYPFLQRYMGGHQRDVTAILAYSVQACHDCVPPEEVYGILKTIAHNFITERCSGEQMAVGINAARAICSRVPSILRAGDDEGNGSSSLDMEAFARDLAAYGKHRDRSVGIAGKAWTNFIREVHPGLLQGKDRGLAGTALHKAGHKPLKYGQTKASAGVEGSDLLVAYEARKAAKRKNGEDTDSDADDDESDGLHEEPMNDEIEDEGDWEDVADEGENGIEEDEEAPTLVLVDGDGKPVTDDDGVMDVSKMSVEERDKLKQDVSATRIFSAADFAKMRQLVDREQRAKRDPREAARRKRAIARGEDYDDLSDSDDSDDEEIRVSGAVNPMDIAAEAKRKRQSKAERLESILAGREKFETQSRDGSSTNTEKMRNKNFMMSKHSFGARNKGNGKTALKMSRKDSRKFQGTHDAKKRRRKM